jgi:hypothetical protein
MLQVITWHRIRTERPFVPHSVTPSDSQSRFLSFKLEFANPRPDAQVKERILHLVTYSDIDVFRSLQNVHSPSDSKAE